METKIRLDELEAEELPHSSSSKQRNRASDTTSTSDQGETPCHPEIPCIRHSLVEPFDFPSGTLWPEKTGC